VPIRFRLSWPLALTVLFWAFNYIALKLAYKEFSASQLAFVRYLAMYAALAIICYLSKESFRLAKRDFWPVMTFGFLSMGLYMFLFLEGMRWAGPAEGAILLNSTPILVLILAAAMKTEKLTAGSLVGAIIGFLGVVLVTSQGAAHGANKMLGYGLLLAAALVWAFCIVQMKGLLARYSPLRLMTLSMPGGFVPMFLYWLVRDHGVLPLHVSWLGWLEFGHVAMLSGVAGFLLFYRGVQQVGSGEAALWIYFIPPLTAIFQWLFMHALLTPLQFVGLFVVIAGVATAQHFRGVTTVPVAPAEPA